MNLQDVFLSNYHSRETRSRTPHISSASIPVIEESQSRQLTHYKQDSLAKIDFEEYIRTIGEDMIHSYSPEKQIALNIQSELKKENKILGNAGLKLQKENKKLKSVLNTLRKKLEQINVSNAKLLYINRALENASLNERQKKKVVEAISKAGSVQEAKVVFETLQETIGDSLVNETRESSLNEMVSRKSLLLVAARHEQNHKEASPLFIRLQKLAGIKTK